jgi:hypothetical protein
MTTLTRQDNQYIRSRTNGKLNRQGRMLSRLWDETGRKRRKMTIAPGIVFIRAK